MSEKRPIRIRQETIERCDRLRRAGAYAAYTRGEFMTAILEIGMNKYEKAILPVETMEDYPVQTGPEIIPFPGCKTTTGTNWA